ncbi:hypothetical protein QTP88_017697 [Uroleucon formosanum]
MHLGLSLSLFPRDCNRVIILNGCNLTLSKYVYSACSILITDTYSWEILWYISNMSLLHTRQSSSHLFSLDQIFVQWSPYSLGIISYFVKNNFEKKCIPIYVLISAKYVRRISIMLLPYFSTQGCRIYSYKLVSMTIFLYLKKNTNLKDLSWHQGTILIFTEMFRMVFQILLNVIFAWHLSFYIIYLVLLINSVAVFTFKLCFWSALLRECVIVKIKLIIFTETIKSVDVNQ